MAVGDLQFRALSLVSMATKLEVQHEKTFPWLSNTHSPIQCGKHFDILQRVLIDLGGNVDATGRKGRSSICCDAYIGGDHNFIIEFDEFQHFSSPRLHTLRLYPQDLCIGFGLKEYSHWCEEHRGRADGYRSAKTTVDFDFHGGRTAQRAYFDVMKDLVPEVHGLRGTVRISEFELPIPLDESAQCLSKLESTMLAKRALAGHFS